MISETAAAIAAVISVALLIAAVAAAGGWRRDPASRGALPLAERRAELNARRAFDVRWRAAWITVAGRAAMLVALGLTPLGARFVHWIAPSGGGWGAGAALVILVMAVWAARLPAQNLRRRARQLAPRIAPRRPGSKRRALALLVGIVIMSAYLVWAVSYLLGDPGVAVVDCVGVGTITALLWPLLPNRVVSQLPRPERLARLAESVAIPPTPGKQPVVAEGWPFRRVQNAAAVGPRRAPAIVVAPAIASALTDRQLRGTIAHEAGHLLRNDPARRLLRLWLLILASAMTALALHGVPELRAAAGLAAPVTARAFPFLLGVGYLTSRLLWIIHLRACRAEERTADDLGLKLAGDADGFIDGLDAVQALIGVPDRWTLPQRLVIATHPARADRLHRLASQARPELTPSPGAGGPAAAAD